MGEKTYSIKEVTEMLDIESYVLRYYEKELKLDIHRNTQGHRIYAMKDIELLKQIKELREQGLELKAVKNILSNTDIDSLVQMNTGSKPIIPQMVMSKDIDITNNNDEHVMQFSMMMKDMLKQALVEYHGPTKEEIKEELSQEVTVMVEKKMREMEVSQVEKSEDYYHKMDETMREMRRMQKELVMLKEGQEKVGFLKRLFGSKSNKKNLDYSIEEKESM